MRLVPIVADPQCQGEKGEAAFSIIWDSAKSLSGASPRTPEVFEAWRRCSMSPIFYPFVAHFMRLLSGAGRSRPVLEGLHASPAPNGNAPWHCPGASAMDFSTKKKKDLLSD